MAEILKETIQDKSIGSHKSQKQESTKSGLNSTPADTFAHFIDTLEVNQLHFQRSMFEVDKFRMQ